MCLNELILENLQKYPDAIALINGNNKKEKCNYREFLQSCFSVIDFYKKQNYFFQIIRGIVHSIGFIFVLKGVLLLPLSVVYPVLFTSPLMLLVLSHFFLSDNINIIREGLKSEEIFTMALHPWKAVDESLMSQPTDLR